MHLVPPGAYFETLERRRIVRDPARVDKLLDVIRRIYAAYPDLRLTQMLENVYPRSPLHPLAMYTGSFYNLEDERVARDLDKFYFHRPTERCPNGHAYEFFWDATLHGGEWICRQCTAMLGQQVTNG